MKPARPLGMLNPLNWQGLNLPSRTSEKQFQHLDGGLLTAIECKVEKKLMKASTMTGQLGSDAL